MVMPRSARPSAHAARRLFLLDGDGRWQMPRLAAAAGSSGTGGCPVRCDLPVKLRGPGNDDGPGWLAAGPGEVLPAVAGHEHETARCRRPVITPAESGELALEQIEHLIFARMDMGWATSAGG